MTQIDKEYFVKDVQKPARTVKLIKILAYLVKEIWNYEEIDVLKNVTMMNILIQSSKNVKTVIKTVLPV